MQTTQTRTPNPNAARNPNTTTVNPTATTARNTSWLWLVAALVIAGVLYFAFANDMAEEGVTPATTNYGAVDTTTPTGDNAVDTQENINAGQTGQAE